MAGSESRRHEQFVSTQPLLEKLGVHAGAKVLLVGVTDRGFVAQLRAVGADVHETETATDFDLVFLRAANETELARLRELRELISQNGAVWLLVRKGAGRTLTEAQTTEAGQQARLVDVKVVNFSPEESAVKFVIRLRDRT